MATPEFMDRRDVGTERPLDFTRNSEGFKAKGSITGRIQAEIGELTGMMGKTIGNGLNQLDEDLGNVARNLAKDEASKLYAAEGIDDGRLPPALVKEIQGLKDMKEASDSGAMDTASFNVKLLAATKRLKTSWAGHQDYIDKGLREMGFTPAADVKRDRVAAANEAKKSRDSATKRDADFETWAIKQAPTAVLEWNRSGSKDVNDLRAIVLRHGAQEKNLQLDSQLLANKIARGNVTKQEAESSLNLVGSTALERMAAATTGTYAQIQANAKAYAESLANGTTKPGELEVLQAQSLELRRQFVNEVTMTYMKHPGFNVDSETSKKSLNNTIQMFDNLMSTVIAKDVNLGGSLAAAVESRNKALELQFLNDPTVANAMHIRKVFGEAYYETWKQQNPDIAKAIDRTLAGDATLAAATGRGQGSIKTDFETMLNKGVQNPNAYAHVLDTTIEALKHPQVPVQTRQNLFNYLFSDKNIGMIKMLDEKDQISFFAKLTSPENYKTAQELATKFNDKTFEAKYKKVLVTSFADLNEQTAHNFNNIIKNNETHYLSINPTTLQVEAKQLVAPNQDSGRWVGNWMVGTLNAPDQASLDRFNTSFAALVPIFTANGYTKLQMINEMNTILENMGVNLKDQTKERSLSREAVDAVKKTITPPSRSTLPDRVD